MLNRRRFFARIVGTLAALGILPKPNAGAAPTPAPTPVEFPVGPSLGYSTYPGGTGTPGASGTAFIVGRTLSAEWAPDGTDPGRPTAPPAPPSTGSAPDPSRP